MAIVFSCRCGKQLQAKEEFAGRRIRCPTCQEVLTIPGGGDEAKQQPAATDQPKAKMQPAEGPLVLSAAASPWFDPFLGQKVTPWLPGDEARCQKGVVPPRDGPNRLARWLVVLLVAGALGAAAFLWLPDFLDRVQNRVQAQGKRSGSPRATSTRPSSRRARARGN